MFCTAFVGVGGTTVGAGITVTTAVTGINALEEGRVKSSRSRPIARSSKATTKDPINIPGVMKWRNNLNTHGMGSKKNAMPRIKYTASNSAPSNQLDSPSADTKAAIKTPATRASNSN